VTPLGIEPATFWLAAQCLNHPDESLGFISYYFTLGVIHILHFLKDTLN
jgi:hypothetical protein